MKGFDVAKARLSEALEPKHRRTLSMVLAERSARTVARAGFEATIVTGDAEVTRWATGKSLQLIREQAPQTRATSVHGSGLRGLNHAAHQVSEAAAASRRPWLIVHADLPNLSTSDIQRLVDVVADGRVVLSPSYDGGTSALGSIGRVPFRYGPLSFHRHLAAVAGTDHRIVWTPGLAFDLDAPSDLVAAARFPGSSWLRDIGSTSGSDSRT